GRSCFFRHWRVHANHPGKPRPPMVRVSGDNGRNVAKRRPPWRGPFQRRPRQFVPPSCSLTGQASFSVRKCVGKKSSGRSFMLGLMQEWLLLCHKILDNAARQHGHLENVTRTVEGPIVRTN